MEILKLLFHHDLTLSVTPDANDPLAMFTKPSPTYSYFRLSATNARDGVKVGLSNFSKCDAFLDGLKQSDILPKNFTKESNSVFAASNESSYSIPESYANLQTELAAFISEGEKICYWQPVQGGADLCILSKENIYEKLFYLMKPFIGNDVRLFSMNGKRISNNKLFYFEGLSHGRLPHGVEEVTENINY